jgi:hypothetical protein
MSVAAEIEPGRETHAVVADGLTAPGGFSAAVGRSLRQPELDALRGLLLVWMTLTHLPTRVSAFANQPFGFVSAAEGFVFLSAVLTGKLHGKLATRGADTGKLRSKLWSRATRVYGYHLLLLAFAFTVGAALAHAGHRPALHNLLDFYFDHPLVAMVSSMLLIYCPPLLDILPMYVIFLLLTPVLLLGARRFGWSAMLFLSAGIWLWAQFGLRLQLYLLLSRITGVHIPMQAMGAFNLYAWQLLWAVGVWIGAEMWLGRNPMDALPRWTWWLALAIVAAGICLRRDWPTGIFWDGNWNWLQDKWKLAPLRVVNFAAVGLVLWKLRRWLRAVLNRGPLPALGMASIQVFTAHVVFVFLGLALIYSDSDTLVHGWKARILVGVSLLGLVATGAVVAQRKLRERSLRRASVATPVKEPQIL